MNAVLQPANCYHCGLPVPAGSRWSTEIEGVVQPMCCPGCAAVADSIVGSGFADYYRNRSSYAERASVEAPPELALLDKAEEDYSVSGIRCAACVWLIERQLQRLPGVTSADMSATTGRLRVAGRFQAADVVRALHAIGYQAWPFDAARHGQQLERERKTLFRQLFIAGLSMMQVMMYAVPVYLAGDDAMDADMLALMQWASLLLTLPAVCYSALPFWRGAWHNLRAGMPGMDVPVALGIGAAFAGSVAALLRGQGDVYFDSITMFIFLLLGSRYLELAARRKAAAALEELRHVLPVSSARMADYPASRETELVAASALREGDVVLVRPGEAAPADGVIVEGDTDVDVSLLTGESLPVRKSAGESLPGGAINAGQPVLLRVSRVAADSTLAMLVRLIESAALGKPRIALWADRVAAWFVAGLLLFTVGVFLAWQAIDPARAWQVAIAVLVVSCPCALSLATPTALAAATSALVRRGVLVVQPHVLETLQRATHIIFDKTGTLTRGKPALRRIVPMALLGAERCLQLAAALEEGSSHPLASAFIDAAGAHRDAASEVRHLAGEGVEGIVGGVRYRLGSAAFLGVPATGGGDAITIYLGTGTTLLARFELADALREDAAQMVLSCQAAGKEVILLSGDSQQVTTRIGRELGIREALGEHLPAEKLAFVKQLQAGGAVVAMVGDGINDAAVLRAADVSFAMGGGTALAQLHADCVLLSGRLSSLTDTARTARRTLAVIRQNLTWATAYNLIAIPAAACGLLNPWMSGIGMSVSSALVVVNALRLRRQPARRSRERGNPSPLAT
ncbi:MAG: cadmium-translocating P-type ATPase [Massilia sp.]|nr:cadmium-translocating P-type ATPase [Massilia sp.]